MATKTDNKGLVVLAIIVVVAMLVLLMFSMKDEDTLGERMDNAAHEFTEGVEDAGEELDPDRTWGEEVGDAIEDAGEDMQNAVE